MTVGKMETKEWFGAGSCVCVNRNDSLISRKNSKDIPKWGWGWVERNGPVASENWNVYHGECLVDTQSPFWSNDRNEETKILLITS